MRAWKRGLARLVAAASLVAIAPASATIVFNIAFDDPGGTYASYDAAIASSLQAAGARWSSVLLGSATIDLVVGFANIPTANGGSSAVSFVHTNEALNVFEQGAGAKLHGVDANGSVPDARINLGFNYLMNELWFDPDPFARTAIVPADRTDAVSVFIHELGHIFAFNVYRDSFNGTLPGNYETTFDELTRFDGTNFYFFGSRARALYGADVPVTYGNIAHIGNAAPRPGADLIPDLMNGVAYFRGTRYDISALDLAIACDIGVANRSCAQAIPEPDGLALFGLAALAWRDGRRRHA